jgi:hypothetical protein
MTVFTVLAASTFFCTAPQVHDGDSLRCGGERIRIANIDAPELPDSPRCTDPGDMAGAILSWLLSLAIRCGRSWLVARLRSAGQALTDTGGPWRASR